MLRHGAVVAAAPAAELAGAEGAARYRSLPLVSTRPGLGPLLALRWHMVRSPRAQRGFAALAGCGPRACVAAVARRR